MARGRDRFEDYDEHSPEPKRDGLATGLVCLTTLVLLAAVFFMQKALKDHFNAGMFKDKGAATGTP